MSNAMKSRLGEQARLALCSLVVGCADANDVSRIIPDDLSDQGVFGETARATTIPKAAVHAVASTGADDTWLAGEQLALRYCVSDDFGGGKPLMVAAMEAGGQAWREVANVRFLYDPSQDADCGKDDTVPNGYVFKVAPWTQTWACAFFPSDGGCVDRTVVYTLAAADGVAPDDSLANATQVLTHELGHTLGLAHENQRADWATTECVDPNMNFLTDIDTASIMSAGPNGCQLSAGSTVSVLDGVGLRILYGMPVAWHASAIL